MLMTIVWRGLGFLVLVIAAAALLLTGLLVESLMGDPKYSRTHGWPTFLAFWIAAGANFLVGRHLNRESDGPWYERRHAFFWLPMEWWGPIYALIGVVYLFVKR